MKAKLFSKISFRHDKLVELGVFGFDQSSTI